MSKSGALTPDQNERVRAVARRLKHDLCEDNESQLARQLGVKQPTISRFLSGTQGTSLEVASKIAHLAGVDVGDLLGIKTVVDTSTSQAQPHHPQVRFIRGIEHALERAKAKWGRTFAEEDFERMLNFSGLSLPELLDDAVMFQLLSTARAANAAVKAHAIDPEQQEILDEMARLEAEEDAAYEAQQKAKAAGAEGHTPKPGSAVRKKKR